LQSRESFRPEQLESVGVRRNQDRALVRRGVPLREGSSGRWRRRR